MNNINILWVDDEIDLLKPHIIFLEKKGYSVETSNNGVDAIEMVKDNTYDIIFLDENMPGMGGFEVLSEIKNIQKSLPVVMITKSEEEYIMEDAIGNNISDYLIKPVNPHQILLSLKKIIDHSRLVSEKTNINYQQEFRNISMSLNSINTYEEWVEVYDKLVDWEIKFDNIEDDAMLEILKSQKEEANNMFFKFVENNYESWFNNSNQDKPILSHEIFEEIVYPELSKDNKVLFVVIDNLRKDQLEAFFKHLNKNFKTSTKGSYFSILPTATQYSRNSIFSGLTPLDMERRLPEYWKNDNDEGGKNLYEKEFLEFQLKMLNKEDIDFDYFKVTNLKSAQKLTESFHNHKDNDLIALVYNFIDTLSHSKTDTEVVKELASTDKAYRSLTTSWFKNSHLLKILSEASDLGFKIILTTDHGTINVKNATKVIGDKNTSLNLRYKTGRSLTYNNKDVYSVKNPNSIMLPSSNMTSSFIFAKNDLLLAYPNNYNHYVSYYKNTYQHGGISLEEMIIPYVVLEKK